MRRIGTIALLALSTSCGALGAPARGDRDLPSSLFGGYAVVGGPTSPNGSTALVAADDGSFDEPSVIRGAEGRRALYVTHRSGDGRVRIARLTERSANHLRFDELQTVLEPALPWEGTAVSSPSVLAIDGVLWMAYAANGAIGVARSSDGARFEREAEPILRASAMHDEGATLSAPSLARLSDGTFAMAYASSGKLFLARASSVSGPWTRVGFGAIATPRALEEGGVESLGDPAIFADTTAAGRSTVVIAATVTNDPRTPTAITAFASYDATIDRPTFSRAERPLYAERSASVFAGSFDRVDPRTTLLWVARTDSGRRVIGALITPGGQRAGNPLQ
jgi:hypothetical protein